MSFFKFSQASQNVYAKIKKVQKLCDFGSDLCTGLEIATGKHFLPVKLIHSSCDVAKSFIDMYLKYNIFCYQNSSLMTLQECSSILYKYITKYPGVIVSTSKEYYQVSLHETDSKLLFYCYINDGKLIPEIIMYKKDYATQTIKYLSDCFWEDMDNNITLVESSFINQYKKEFDCYKNSITTGYCHDNFNKLQSYIQAFINKGKSRSILLYGYPGTGKTTTCKILANKLKLKTIVLPLLELKTMLYIERFKNLFNILQPEMVIIDEFDKVGLEENSFIYELLEYLNKNCKVVIATANNINKIKNQPGLIRPGRFDKIIKFNSIDKRVLSDILGEGNQEFLEGVKYWPPAFVQELKNIIDVFGIEKGRKEIPILRKRVLENKTKVIVNESKKQKKESIHLLNEDVNILEK